MKVPSPLADLIFEEEETTRALLAAVQSGNSRLTHEKTAELTRVLQKKREMRPPRR